jgi:predicted transcriptional regulator
MNLEKLREQIKQELNGTNLTNSERVILSTLLYNNTFETAFKLRLSIRQIETTLNDFKTKLQGATS